MKKKGFQFGFNEMLGMIIVIVVLFIIVFMIFQSSKSGTSLICKIPLLNWGC